MWLSDHLTCFQRNLYAGQEATVRTRHGKTNWFKIGKGVHKGYILSLCLFNLYAEYIMQNARLNEAQAGVKITRRNINNLTYSSGRKWRGIKEPLDELFWKRREKAGLKLNIQKTKIMAPGSITSWPIDGETMETVTDFIFLGSKITADGDCSHEINRCLLLGRKVMTNLDSVVKSKVTKDTLLTKVRLVKAMVFPVVMYGCESWPIKKTEHRRIDAFELCVVLEKTLESPLNCKEIKPVNPKGNESWIFIGILEFIGIHWKDWSSNTLATWCEEPTH